MGLASDLLSQRRGDQETYQTKNFDRRETVMTVLEVRRQCAIRYPRTHHSRESTESHGRSQERQDVGMSEV